MTRARASFVHFHTHTSILSMQGTIHANKAVAQLFFRSLLHSPSPSVYHLYSDGSRSPAGVGAAAVDLHHGRQVFFRLGAYDSYSVDDAEFQGVLLGLLLVRELPVDARVCYIHVDRQGTIQALTRTSTNPKFQSFVDVILDAYQNVLKSRPGLRIRLNWVPSHVGIRGNETADSYAKKGVRLEMFVS